MCVCACVRACASFTIIRGPLLVSTLGYMLAFVKLLVCVCMCVHACVRAYVNVHLSHSYA